MPIRLVSGIVAYALTVFSNAAVAQELAAIEAGEQIYNTYCVNCHGMELQSSGLTFDLRRLRADERGRFTNSVLNGKRQMPPWRGVLQDHDLELLWTYIRANAYEK